MKKLLLLSVVCLMSLATFAQKNADAVVAELTSKVELSDVQKTKLMSIENQFVKDYKEISNLKSTEPKVYYAKLSYLKDVKLGEVRDLMTEAQMDGYTDYVKARAKIRNENYKKWQAEDLPELEIRIRMMEAM